MKKTSRLLVCLVGGATLFAAGCGGAPVETPVEPEQQPTAEPQPGEVRQQGVYTVCWPELGYYQSPSTSSIKMETLKLGRDFITDSSVFWANGEYWVRGKPACPAGYTCNYYGSGYVRWDGLC